MSGHNLYVSPDSKVHGVYMGLTWGRQDPGGPHVGPWPLLSGSCNVPLNSLDLVRYGSYSKCIIFRRIIKNSSLSTRYQIDLKWMPQDLTDEKSTLVQVMVWCRQSNVNPDLRRHIASLGHIELNLRDLVVRICVSKLCPYWFRLWPGTWPSPSHYLK